MATEYVIPNEVLDQLATAVPLEDIVAAVGAEHSWDATSLIQRAVEAAAPLIVADYLAQVETWCQDHAHKVCGNHARNKASDADPTPDCSRPSTWGSCIHALASGWITSSDLCPGCSGRFMAALDREVEGLKWHPNYLTRPADDHG